MAAPDRRVYDDTVLQSAANATSNKERQMVLNIAVNLKWAAETIGMIRRFEKQGARHHYGMWRYPSEVSKDGASGS